MEFWGVEVKTGESVKVEPGNGMLIHLSQTALGVAKKDKGTEPVYVHLIVEDRKFVLGTLSHEKFPQISLDVALEKGFQLSHSWKDGSVYFSGYKFQTQNDISGTDEDTEDEFPLITDNGKSEPKVREARAEAAKVDAGVSKRVNFKEPNNEAKPKQEDDDSDEDEDDDNDMSSSEESGDDEKVAGEDGSEKGSGDHEDDEDDDEESSDEETPKKPEPSKKRIAESAFKTPAADKKAKFVTPQKTDGKKGGGYVATPHRVKQAGKQPATSEQPKQPTPKPTGVFPCKSCNRSFTTEMGLQSHTKAKHDVAA